MRTISIQGMNCGRSNCCHGNFNFCICQVWMCNTEIIRLWWIGVWHIPLTHPIEAIPSYVPPYQLHAPTSDAQQVPTPGQGNIGLFFCLSFSESIEFLPDTVNLQVSLLRLAHRIRCDLCCLVQCAFSTCLVTLIRSLAIPEHFLLASHSYRVMDIFYVVKSKAIYYIATSTRPSQNPKPYSRGLNKVICSLSIYTISFLDEYIAQKDSSFRPFL